MGYLLGQRVRLSFETFSDPEREEPADPTAVSVALLDPAGELTNSVFPDGEVVRDALGVFHLDVAPTLPGRHEAYWTSVGVVTAHSEVFYVRAPFTTSVSVDDVRRHLQDDEAELDEDELGFFLDTASEWVAKKVPSLSPNPVRMAILNLVEHLWDTQRGPAAGPLDPETLTRPGAGYAIPNRVAQMIAPYMTGSAPRGSFPPITEPRW